MKDQHHHHAVLGKEKGHKRIQEETDELKDDLTEKTQHGHEEAMDHPMPGVHGKGDTAHGHHDHHRMMIDDFKKRFWISLILSIPVLVLSPMIQDFLGAGSALAAGALYSVGFVTRSGGRCCVYEPEHGYSGGQCSIIKETD